VSEWTGDFQNEDDWQRGIRDRILLPAFYGKYSLDGHYVVVDQGAMATLAEKRSAVDTLAVSRRTGKVVRIEEKINRAPKKRKAFRNYALETDSCTISGYESVGWMHYSTADLLLIAFANRKETELDVHLLDLPGLKEWFWPRIDQFEDFINPGTSNASKFRVVPFIAVPSTLLVWRGIVRAPQLIVMIVGQLNLTWPTEDLVHVMCSRWIVEHWPKVTDHTTCRHCGAKDDNLIPMGYGPRPMIWLHRDPCFNEFRAVLRAKARRALGFE
jgi:hypothetical protein